MSSETDSDPYRSPNEISEATTDAATGWSLTAKALILMGVVIVLFGAGVFLTRPVVQFSEMNRAGPPIEIMQEDDEVYDDYEAAMATEAEVVVQDDAE